MQKVRIIDVAAAAEVSRATVTNALNGTGRMSIGTRVRVRAIAAQLGYRVPVRTLALGVSTPDAQPWDVLGVPYYATAIDSAMAAAHRKGYGLTVLPAGSAGWEAVAADGVLILDPLLDDPLTEEAARAGLPVVHLGRPVAPTAARTCWVDNDHEVGTRVVLDHLAALGARRITLIAGDTTDHYTRSSVAAYEAWCRANDRAAHVVEWELGGADPAEEALAARPDAVYGIYENLGLPLLRAAHRHGLRVPDDLLVVCFSEDAGYAAIEPAVTTVSHRVATGARLAVEALVTALEGQGRPPAVVVPGRLDIRASTVGARRG
uniref:LacI family DNA-binding transcriptional regulator n=1 Tax=Streptomyces polyasparticus TaxID=2767826 RepID=UPI00280AE5D6|nr:LacI family DNA-binding transcriptional regulator [Streptomyces polyasparticus]